MHTRGPMNSQRPSGLGISAPQYSRALEGQCTYMSSICAAWLKRSASMLFWKATVQMPCDAAAYPQSQM